MKKIIEKGYTISVDSWENDGDNSRTKSITVPTLEEVRMICGLCDEVFTSGSNGGKGIGNFNDGQDAKAARIILPYMKAHPELYEGIEIEYDEQLVDICMDYAHQLLGGSEWYYCRVMERYSVTYSPEDVYLEEIKVK